MGYQPGCFNGIRVSLDGKVSSIVEQQKFLVDDLQRRIARAERQISEASENSRWQQVHHKNRRLINLKSRLDGLKSDIQDGRVRLCFGSKRLWRKQHNLKLNGYGSPFRVAPGLAGIPQWRVLRSGKQG